MPSLQLRKRSLGRVRASARGGVGTTQRDTKYINWALNPGELLVDIEYIKHDKKGDAGPGSVTHTPEIMEIVDINRVRQIVKAKAEGMVLEAYAKGKLDAELDRLESTIKQQTVKPFRRFTQEVTAKGHPMGAANNYSYIDLEVIGYILDIGAPGDEEKVANQVLQLVTSTPIPNNVRLDPNRWGFRASHHRIEHFNRLLSDYRSVFHRIPDYNVRANDKGASQRQPSMYYDIFEIPVGSVVTFRPTVRSETHVPGRILEIVIWEIPAHINSSTGKVPIGTDWKTFEVKHKKLHDGAIRVEVYWHDNIESDIILNGNATSVTYI